MERDYNWALDEVLIHLKEIQFENGKIEYWVQQTTSDNGDRIKLMLANFQSKIEIDNWEFYALLDQLIEDKLIVNKNCPKLTLKGIYFRYTDEENKRIKKEKEMEKRDKEIFDLNHIASWGGFWAFVVALCYFVFELVKFFHEHNCGCHRH